LALFGNFACDNYQASVTISIIFENKERPKIINIKPQIRHQRILLVTDKVGA
jgi:hypothetical protein